MQQEEHKGEATAGHPALVIFLLDTSGSMGDAIARGDDLRSVPNTKIEIVTEALNGTLKYFAARSRKGSDYVSPRYRVAVFTYSSSVTPMLGVTPISDEKTRKLPELSPQDTTNTRAAFEEARKLLEAEIKPGQYHPRSPAPLVCHLTDGEYNVPEGEAGNPLKIAEDIKAMRVPDGHVLVSNIFVSDKILTDTEKEAVRDIHSWPGITDRNQLVTSPNELNKSRYISE